MKKIIVALAVLLSFSFGAQSSLDVANSAKVGDINSLVDAGFELKKRASIEGVEDANIAEACNAFHNVMQKSMSGKTAEEIKAFRNEIYIKTYEKLATLPKAEQDKFDIRACSKFVKKGTNKQCMNSSKPCVQNVKACDDCPKMKQNCRKMNGDCPKMNGNACPKMRDNNGSFKDGAVGPKKDGCGKGIRANQGMNPNCPYAKDGNKTDSNTTKTLNKTRGGGCCDR